MKQILLIAFLTLLGLAPNGVKSQETERSLVTDEPVFSMGKPEGAPEYVAKAGPEAGQYLALTMHKLQNGLETNRPLLIWAIGSSYTNMLGSGEFWQEEIPKRFPNAPQIRYEKMVGNSCPWQYLRGWARHLVIPDQPDLVITYTLGKPEDLEKLIVELRTQTTADIIVPSIHWRMRGQDMWGKSENSPDQDIEAVREVCRKYDVEFVESRRDWAAYLEENNLPIESLLKDAVHQSDYGAQIINSNIFAHFQPDATSSYALESRERVIQAEVGEDGKLSAVFTGTRIDLIGRKSPEGGTFQVLIDGKTDSETEAFLMSYVLPDPKNAKVGRGSNPRDQSPHGVILGEDVVPQEWTITMTSDEGDYRIEGSVTGVDGEGNAFEAFKSNSGQIEIDPYLWRRAERNRTGDFFTFEVKRAVLNEISFEGAEGEEFVVRLAQLLLNEEHTLELVPIKNGSADIDFLQVFEPPLKRE
ncbi:MAG: SGNH/GDSL hydrolase family protein [Verrucomicrobiales bacterium]|nr:SGNH/GDSL hydrolase family protein [Verrucomicrobiales bacterium]